MVIGVIGLVITSVVAGLLIIVANGAYFFKKFESYIADVASKSFFQIVRNVYGIIPVKNKVFILIQFIVLIIATISLVMYVKKKTKPILTRACFSRNFRDCESRTDLDMLYRILISKKEINLGDIERLFEVNGEVALDWCKVLENADLALIDYPNFQKPVLRLPEDSKKIKGINNGPIVKEVLDTITREKKLKIVESVAGKTNVAKKIKPVVKKSNVKVASGRKVKSSKRKSTLVVHKKQGISKKILRKKNIVQKSVPSVKSKVPVSSVARKSVPSRKGTVVPVSSGKKRNSTSVKRPAKRKNSTLVKRPTKKKHNTLVKKSNKKQNSTPVKRPARKKK
ncbi:hypothetical protein KAS08_05065 [Candidatus Pacearchaeota archaeon]|nr:hypothetical protein [Candidatus Pacearchaeota archaeon]